MSTVPRIWDGATVAILASGPSLTADDVAYVRGRAKAIAINTTYTVAPWADVLYAADHKWWRWMSDRVKRKEWPDFTGLRFSLTRGSDIYGAKVLRRGREDGLSLDPAILNSGKNGGFQAINLAVLLGAIRVVLLGYDMQRGPKGQEHHHPDHPNKSHAEYTRFLPHFATLVEPLKAAGVEIVNCTPRTALTCFKRAALRDVLPAAAEVAA